MNPDELLELVDASDLSRKAKGALRARLTLVVTPHVLNSELAFRIEGAACSDEGKVALRAAAGGVPPWTALEQFAHDDISATWSAMEDLGIVECDVPSLLQRKARIAAIADSRIESHLLDPAKEASLFELNVVGGTATDKLLKHTPEVDRGNQLAELIAELHAQGGGEASVTTTVKLDSGRTIDVQAE